MSADRLYHIACTEAWERSEESGEYRVETLESEGFIHFSTLEQCAGTAKLYYKDAPELLLLCIEASRLKAPLRWEESRGGALFPHLYGPLNREAVLEAFQWRPSAAGIFEKPSPDRNLTIINI